MTIIAAPQSGQTWLVELQRAAIRAPVPGYTSTAAGPANGR